MLKLTSLITPSAMLAAITLAAAPSFAQERYHGREKPSGQESGGRSTERAQPRSEAPRTGGAAPRVESRQETPRAQPPRPADTPRVETSRPNAERSGGENRARNQNFGNESLGRAVPRRDTVAPRVDENRRNDSRRYDSRRDDNRRFESRSYTYAPRYSPRVYSPRSYYRPYVFRPRLSIGFGIFSGYPVPYSYSYPYPIEVYGYGAPRSRVMMTPGSSYYGGVSLEITPYDADVFVDGEYAGRVEDFDGTTQPLTLTAGTHRIEVQAQGYAPLVVDVGVQPGQVIPYRGELRTY
jgi:hypothetical protein